MINLPEAFRKNMQNILGNSMAEFEQALTTPSPVSIRANRRKPSVLDNLPLSTKIDWTDDGYYLSERPVFTLDPLLHQGGYYVQEASSMFVEHCLRQILPPGEPVTALDLCAAPGGKSTLIASALPENSLLVANEVIRSRAYILYENLCKWGTPNIIVSNNDPKDFGNLPAFFDVILVDAPCSGEGMFRKDPAAIGEWSEANVKLCAERQQRILADIWQSLKPGGYLLYSTCTYNTLENEENIQWLLDTFDAKTVSIQYNAHWGIQPSLKEGVHAARFFPHKVQGEGFFITVVQKTGDEKQSTSQKRHTKQAKSSYFKTLPKDFAQVTDWINGSGDYYFGLNNTEFIAIPSAYTIETELLKKHLRLIKAGIRLGQIKGKDIIPDTELALSITVSKDIFTSYETDKDSALTFLRREPVILPDSLPKGYILLTYQNKGLGWVKNLGNRTNNLYPQEWRIRMRV